MQSGVRNTRTTIASRPCGTDDQKEKSRIQGAKSSVDWGLRCRLRNFGRAKPTLASHASQTGLDEARDAQRRQSASACIRCAVSWQHPGRHACGARWWVHRRSDGGGAWKKRARATVFGGAPRVEIPLLWDLT